jgi:glycosyltransferase involved in cell wall biosynthesis
MGLTRTGRRITRRASRHRSGRERPLVLHTLAHLGVGGVNSVVLQTLRFGRSFDHSVAFVTADAVTRLEEYRRLGVEPVCLGHAGNRTAVRTLSRAVRLLRELRPDVVHTNHRLDRWYFGIAARMTGTPTVTTLHSSTRPSTKARILSAPSLALSRRFVVVSEAVGKAARLQGVPSSRTRLVPSGIDTKRYQPGPQRSATLPALGVDDDMPLVLAVGRLYPVKAQHLLIEAAEHLVRQGLELNLIIVGDGARRQELESLRERSLAHDRIRLPGARTDIDVLMRAATIFVSASVSEGLPITVLEAMSSGVPVVASDIPPHREVLRHGGGLMFPVGDAAELARAIAALLEDEGRRRTMAHEARRVVLEDFSAELSAQRLGEVYRSVLTEP